MEKGKEGFNTFKGSELSVATCNRKWSRKEGVL